MGGSKKEPVFLVATVRLRADSALRCGASDSSNLEDKHVPLKYGVCQSRNRKPVWMSHKALRSVRRKRKVVRKYMDINHLAVKSACRVARVELRKSRCNFEEKLALNIKNDSKSFFACSRS